MAKNNSKRLPAISLSPAILFVLVLSVDQLSKYWASLYHIVHINYGVSLGVFASLPSIVLTSCLVMVTGIFYHLFKDFWKQQPLVGALFFGAAVSNLIDRLLFNGVRDWLRIPFTTIYNNIADWLLFFAIICILLLMKVEKKEDATSTN